MHHPLVMRRAAVATLCLAWLALASSPASAQVRLGNPNHAPDIELPVVMLDELSAADEADDTDLDLANVVQVAARFVTTVQEAPAIVTVTTQEDIEKRHLRTLGQALDRIPGWMRFGSNHSLFHMPLSRGVTQAMLLIRDGVSMFEPAFNITSNGRELPMELVKRIEVVTGPGGVLWGANSFLGVVSITSKDARDIDGVEASANYGTGPGDANNVSGYVMAGLPDIKGKGVDAVLHAGFDLFESPHFQMPGFLFHSPQPQPNSVLIYGPLDTAAPARSMLINLNASVSKGSWRAHVSWPFGVHNKSLGFAGGLVNETLPEDALPECDSIPDGGSIDSPPCTDRGRVARKNALRHHDRYASVDWRSQFLDNRVALNATGYLTQFVRSWDPLVALPPVAGILPGGLAFAHATKTYRVGTSIDTQLEINSRIRAAAGVEAFREWLPGNVEASRQGAGVETSFAGPYNLDLLPLPCPHEAGFDMATMQPTNAEKIEGCPLTFVFETDRTVLGTYASLQTTLADSLVLDAGVRGQVAPEALSTRPYDPQLLGSAALVYGFLKNWHAKFQFTQGFRPPVFNNTDSNGEAVQIPGSPDLDPERSRAWQGEVNARIKGTRQLRELSFRADYSYTVLDGLIQFPRGQYENAGKRGIHSAEALATANLRGGHRAEIGYTWLRSDSEDLGRLRTIPAHWFNLSLITKITEDLEFMNNLRVASSFYDPNRIVEFRNLSPGSDGITQVDEAAGEVVIVDPTEIVLDHVPASADLQIGVRYRPTEALTLSAIALNAFNGQAYQPDVVSSFSPRLEVLPNPYERLRVYGTATYRY